MSLSSLIVEREVATMRQVEEALARQVIYGGDLVTNLLEIARVDETVLTPLLAESMQIPAAPPGELPLAPEFVRALIPAEFAVQSMAVALDVERRKIVLAVAEPLAPDVRGRLSSALEMEVEQLAAPAVRIWQALARAYGVQLDRRVQRLIGRLSGASTPSLSPGSEANSAPPGSVSAAPPGSVSAGPPGSVSVGHRSAHPSRSSVPPTVGAVAQPLRIAAVRLKQRHPTLKTFPQKRASSRPAAGESAAAAASVVGPEIVASPASPGSEHHAAMLQRNVSPSMRPSRRRRGPLTFEAVRREADEAVDRDALLDLYFDFSRQFFDYAALFLVQGDIAEGRDAFGAGAARERVLGIGVPLDMPSILATTREKRVPVVARAGDEGLDAVLLGDLQRPLQVEMAAVPLVVRTRAVALLVGDCSEAGVDRDAIQQVLACARVVGKGFERIIVRRKLEGFVAATRSIESAATRSIESYAGAAEIASDPPASSPPPGGRSPPSSPSSPSAPAPTPAAATAFRDWQAPAGAAPVGQMSTNRTLVAGAVPAATSASFEPTATRPPHTLRGPFPAPAGTPPPAANIASVRPVARPPLPREEPEIVPDAAAPREPSAPPRRITDSFPGRIEQPAGANAESLGAPFDLTAFQRRASDPWRPDHPGPASMGRPPDDGRREQDPAPRASGGQRLPPAGVVAPPHQPVTAGIVVPPPADPAPRASDGQRLPPAGVVAPPHQPVTARERVEERSLPTVIIDLDGDLGRIVDRIARGEADEAAEAELLHYGERAMPAVMQRFPGPVTFDRNRIATMTHPPRASECGPVLRLIARERKVALPFVLDRLTSPDLEARGWATYLIAELPYAEAIPRLIERLRDDDASIRVAAAHAIAAIARPFSDQVAEALKDLARSPDARSRAVAARAMAEVREPWVVPELIASLRDVADEVAAAAHSALVLVVRQDFGRDPRPWLRWYDQNGRRNRIEWLIDALTHETAEIRRASGEELRALSRQYFGYASELPPRDRERAQQRYRDWWITEGRARQRHS